MTFANIHDWLHSDRDYERGVAIYKEHGKSTVLKNLFSKGANPYTREKLYAELNKLNGNNPTQEPEPTQQGGGGSPEPYKEGNFRRFTQPKGDRVVVSDLPEDLKEIYYQNLKPALDERSYLHNRLELMPDSEREQAAGKILDLSDKIDRLYAKLRKYQETGKRDEEDKRIEDMEREELIQVTQVKLKRRNTLRTYISRGGKPEKEEAWRKELNELNEFLGNEN